MYVAGCVKFRAVVLSGVLETAWQTGDKELDIEEAPSSPTLGEAVYIRSVKRRAQSCYCMGWVSAWSRAANENDLPNGCCCCCCKICQSNHQFIKLYALKHVTMNRDLLPRWLSVLETPRRANSRWETPNSLNLGEAV